MMEQKLDLTPLVDVLREISETLKRIDHTLAGTARSHVQIANNTTRIATK